MILDCKTVNSDEKYVEPTVRALTDVLGLDEDKIRSILSAEDTKNSQYQILYEGGDAWISNHVRPEQYEDVNVLSAQMQDYFEEKGGTCTIIDENP